MVAVIEGGHFLTRGLNKTIILNASHSYDPEVGRRNHTGMEFHWSCKRVASPSSTECPVLLNSSSGIVVYLKSQKLQVGVTYRIKVAISKDNRNDEAEQFIEVVKGLQVELSIR